MINFKFISFLTLTFLSFFAPAQLLASALTYGQAKGIYDTGLFGPQKVTCDDLLRSAVRSPGDLFLRTEDKYIPINVINFYLGLYVGSWAIQGAASYASNPLEIDDVNSLLRSVVSACREKGSTHVTDPDVGLNVAFPSVSPESIEMTSMDCKEYSYVATTYLMSGLMLELDPAVSNESFITEEEYIKLISDYFFLDGLMAVYGLSHYQDGPDIIEACNANDESTKVIEILNLIKNS